MSKDAYVVRVTYPLAERRELAGERDEHLLSCEAADKRTQGGELCSSAQRSQQVAHSVLIERRAVERESRRAAHGLGDSGQQRAVAAHSAQQAPRVVQLSRQRRLHQVRLEQRRIRHLLLEARLLQHTVTEYSTYSVTYPTTRYIAQSVQSNTRNLQIGSE